MYLSEHHEFAVFGDGLLAGDLNEAKVPIKIQK